MTPNHKIVMVGDASMSPYEIDREGGSVERWNDESGETWMRRLLDLVQYAVRLNPVYRRNTGAAPTSIGMIQAIMEHRMFPPTIEGIDRAMRN